MERGDGLVRHLSADGVCVLLFSKGFTKTRIVIFGAHLVMHKFNGTTHSKDLRDTTIDEPIDFL
jgi:hypothetical protein